MVCTILVVGIDWLCPESLAKNVLINPKNSRVFGTWKMTLKFEVFIEEFIFRFKVSWDFYKFGFCWCRHRWFFAMHLWTSMTLNSVSFITLFLPMVFSHLCIILIDLIWVYLDVYNAYVSKIISTYILKDIPQLSFVHGMVQNVYWQV